MLFSRIPFILPFPYHKSVTTCHIDSYKVSNCKLNPDLCNCANIETIDLLAIQQKSLDRALFLYIFIHEIRSSGV